MSQHLEHVVPVLLGVLVAGLLLAGAWFGGWVGGGKSDQKAKDLKPPATSVTAPQIGKEEPPEAAPDTGVLVIKTQPEGADVWVDGRLHAARTPTEIQIPPDRLPLMVDIRLKGYKPVVEEISERFSGRQLFERALEPLGTATLRIDSRPRGASVNLDGRDLNAVTPFSSPEIEASITHRVTVTLDGHEPLIEQVRLEPDTVTEMMFNLKRLPRSSAKSGAKRSNREMRAEDAPMTAVLKLNAVPSSETMVYLDGTGLGEAPVIRQVSAGRHTIEFVQGLGTVRQKTTIEVKAGEERTVVWDFDRERWLSR